MSRINTPTTCEASQASPEQEDVTYVGKSVILLELSRETNGLSTAFFQGFLLSVIMEADGRKSGVSHNLRPKKSLNFKSE